MATQPLNRIYDGIVSEPVAPDTPAAIVLDIFVSEPARLLIAVVDGKGRPVGLVDRQTFMLRMAGQYGYALHAKRPVALIMDPAPLIVERSLDLTEFTSTALSTRPSDLMNGFVIVENGLYVGLGTSLDLLRVVHERLRENAAQIERDKIFMEQLVDNIPVMLFAKSAADGRFVLVNRAAETNLGYTRDELIGRHVTEIFSPRAPPEPIGSGGGRTVLATGETEIVANEHVRRKDGDSRWLSTREIAIPDETGAARWIVRVSEDVTERRREQARIEQLAHYDSLTSLSNRVSFQHLLADALAASDHTGRAASVLCVDLDRFKAVNDGLGHDGGDALLREVADRIRACIRAGDGVARLGGDEFAIVLRDLLDEHDVRRLAARIVATLAQPFLIHDQSIKIGASVGFALYPRDAQDMEQLLKCADVALYRAKANGRSRYEAFTVTMQAELKARRGLESELRDAIAHNDLVLHYQPLVESATGRLTSYEALVRWNHPQRGLIGPGDFIVLAEETGLIVPLGRWVLRTACAQAATWPDEIGVSVNVSPLQFRDSRLTRVIASELTATGLSPGRLQLEITEGVLLHDDLANMDTLHEIKRLGCRIALDDFGTGFSSLNYLRRFPFDKIKIDRAFVKDLPSDDSSLAIIRAIAALARALSIVVLAEGVETQAQLDVLRQAGCDEVQGFLFGRPLPAEKLVALDPHAHQIDSLLETTG